MKYIEEMIKEDIKKGKEMLDEGIQKKKEVREKLEKEGKDIKERVIGWDGRAYTILNKEYEDVIEKYKYYLNLNAMYGKVGAYERIEKDIIKHYETLQNKVEKKIGKIIKVEYLGGYDYNFIGEDGKCGVEVILAGGYNIQRKHTRWIITKGVC